MNSKLVWEYNIGLMEERFFYIDMGETLIEVGDGLRETQDLEKSELVYTQAEIMVLGMGRMETGIGRIKKELVDRNPNSIAAIMNPGIRPLEYELYAQFPPDEPTIIH